MSFERHQRTKQREEQAANVLDVGEENGPIRLGVDQKLSVAGEEPVRARVAVPGHSSPGLDLKELCLHSGRWPPGHAESQRHRAADLELTGDRRQRRVPLRVSIEVGEEDVPDRLGGSIHRKGCSIEAHVGRRTRGGSAVRSLGVTRFAPALGRVAARLPSETAASRESQSRRSSLGGPPLLGSGNWRNQRQEYAVRGADSPVSRGQSR
jgi:hypothetical protein